MRATEHLQHAYLIGMTEHAELSRRWIRVMHKIGARWGSAHMITLASNNRIDLLLRQLEREWLENKQSQTSHDYDDADDVMLALAEAWLLRTYEVIRASAEFAKRQGERNDKLDAFKYRLGLVRMPIAKAEIKDAKPKSPEIMLDVLGGERGPKPYKNNGSYIIPRGMCGTTGSVMWWPVDIKRMVTLEIRRQELSDEFLSMFD